MTERIVLAIAIVWIGFGYAILGSAVLALRLM